MIIVAVQSNSNWVYIDHREDGSIRKWSVSKPSAPYVKGVTTEVAYLSSESVNVEGIGAAVGNRFVLFAAQINKGKLSYQISRPDGTLMWSMADLPIAFSEITAPVLETPTS